MAVNDPSRLAPYFRAEQTTLTMALVTRSIVRSNSQRVALLFSVNGANAVWIGPTSNVSANNGTRLTEANSPLEFYYNQIGGVVGLEWYGFSGVAVDMTVLEVIFQPPSADR